MYWTGMIEDKTIGHTILFLVMTIVRIDIKIRVIIRPGYC
jgi:hypothetical protein